MAWAALLFSRRCSTPCCCCSRSARSLGKRCCGSFILNRWASGTVMIVAAVGIVVNGVTAALFASGRKGDLNIRGAFLHMIADAAVSAGVVAAGLVILYTGWFWLDPLTSLGIVAVI